MASSENKRVLVGGVFSIIHPGHIFFLKKARSLGDHLTVVLTHDRNVKKKRGMIIVPAKERKTVMESIRYVDSVIIGDEFDFMKPIIKAKPDIIALGHDQQFDILWLRSSLKKSGMSCRITRISEVAGGYSTSRILSRMGMKAGKTHGQK